MEQIDDLIKKREKILDKDEQDKRIGKLTDKIINLLHEKQKQLPVDYIIESLTKLGYAPSVYYDTNGHFAVCGDGSQSLPRDLDDTDDIEFQTFVEKKYWKNTIREALDFYLDDMLSEE